MLIYPAQKVQIVLLLTEMVTIWAKCLDFANVFLNESAAKLPKHANINKHSINSSNLSLQFT